MVRKLLALVQKVIQILHNIKIPERKQRYLNRHKKNENWNDPKTAGFYATNILWNKQSIKSSVADTNKHHTNLHLKLNIYL